MARFTSVHFAYTLLFFALAAVAGWWRRDQWRQHSGALLLNAGAMAAGLGAIVLLPCRTAGAIGSSVVYFSNVAAFVALPYLFVLVGRNLGPATSAGVGRVWWSCALVGLAGLGGAIYHCGPYLASGPQRLAASVTSSTPQFAQYIKHLLSIRDDDSTHEFLIYIAKRESGFWKAASPYGFGQLPFFIPAVAERAALFGLPMPDREEQKKRLRKQRHFARSETGLTPEGYGYDSYPLEAYEIGSVDRVADDVILAEIRRLGFKGYIDVTLGGWTKHPVPKN